MTVNQGEVMADIGNRMEPNRGPARLPDDVGTTLLYDDAEVTEGRVRVPVQV
ncbi:hypothetical protein [Streptomyces sp. NPDC021356]|uniref:hypothetical protein n=1 Tax=Streptomyces sp. NPDC021356 TaxID=3154900 RepID=UPI0033E2A38C